MTRRDVPSCGSCGYVEVRMTLSWAVTGEPMRSGRCRQCGGYTCSRGHPSDYNTADWLIFTKPLVRDRETGDFGPGQLKLPVCRTGDCVKVLRYWRRLTDHLEKFGPEEMARRLTTGIEKHESGSWQMDLLQTFKRRHQLRLVASTAAVRTAAARNASPHVEQPRDHELVVLARIALLTAKPTTNLPMAIYALKKYGTADDQRWIDIAHKLTAERELEAVGIPPNEKREDRFKPRKKTRAEERAEFERIYGRAALEELLEEEASNRSLRRASRA